MYTTKNLDAIIDQIYYQPVFFTHYQVDKPLV